MKQRTAYLIWIPAASIIVFLILYSIAAVIFPGGSYYNINDKSFSLLHNYWCDLLAERTKRGELNPSRQLSLSAMFILCPAMMLFFYLAPIFLQTEKRKKQWMQTCGFVSMLITMFIFTSFHDLVIPSAGFFGLIALFILFAEFKRNGMTRLFKFGLTCLVLVAPNNFIWYTRIGVEGLPVVQKITFIAFLSWIIWICAALFKKSMRPAISVREY